MDVLLGSSDGLGDTRRVGKTSGGHGADRRGQAERLLDALREPNDYAGLYSFARPRDEYMWSRSKIDSLYRKTRYAVFNRCRSLLGDDAEARDVTQEVYLQLLAQPEGFRGESSPITYVYAIATHRCLTRLRARLGRGPEWQESVAELLRNNQRIEDPEALAEAREILAEALAATDDETAMILVYHFVDGLSQGEVAKLLNLSRVTINQRIHRFREMARRSAGGIS